jgi:RNA polymerase sigma-54 factor
VDQQLVLQHEQRQQVLPRLIEANYLLQLSGLSLDAVINAELQSNPALELMEVRTCPRCGSELEADLCTVCREQPFEDSAGTLGIEHDSEVYHQHREESPLDVDQFSLIAGESNPIEEIRADAFATLPEKDHRTALVIVEALDERGWLSLPLDELARMVGRPEAEVERVLEAVQLIAPPGVGARDLAECLRLQIDELQAQGIEAPGAILRLTENDFIDLASHRYQKLAARLDTTAEEVAAAHAFIRSQLTPNPLQDRTASSWRHAESTQTVTPDVIVRIVNDEVIVSLARRNDARLAINEDYVNLSQLRRNRAASGSDGNAGMLLSDDEWDHVRTSLRSARDFMSKLEQRRRTLLKIATLVCERQEDFLRGSVRELMPLTRSEIAAEIGVNESTVSRATADKYVMLPNRRVAPFSDFFTASLGVKDVIREIIASEAKRGTTLSDQRICDMLGERGYRIARRTVTKYRLQLDILPSRQRFADVPVTA